MKDFQLFENAYILCVKQPGKYLSGYFKKYIDKLLPQKFFENPLRTAMITGYYLRCAETILNQQLAKEPNQQIKDILNSKKDKGEKIEEIADYLDNHDKIGLSEKISNYSLIPFKDTQKIFEIYVEDFINHTLKEKKIKKGNSEIFYELAYRNMAFGYLYKLSEGFVEKNKK